MDALARALQALGIRGIACQPQRHVGLYCRVKFRRPAKVNIPASVVAAGSPAVVKKPLEGLASGWVEKAAEEYVKLSRRYLSQGIGVCESSR